MVLSTFNCVSPNNTAIRWRMASLAEWEGFEPSIR